jgi:hypothetical protein
MENKKIAKLCFMCLFFLIASLKTYAQSSNEGEFILLLENLSKQDFLRDYKDRTTLSNDFKNKLIISDLKDVPFLKNTIEQDNFIAASYAEILKSDARLYILPKKVIINRDSSYIEFDLINKYNLSLKGKFALIKNNSKNTHKSSSLTSHAEFVSTKLN